MKDETRNGKMAMLDEVKKRLRLINIIGAAGVVGLLAGAGVFGVTPLWQAGVQHIGKSVELKKELSDLDGLVLKVARVREERKSREARLGQAEARLPSLAAMNQFVPDLAKVAEAAGLQVDHVAPIKELKDAGGYKLLSVQVAGKGDWETCYKFLTGLREPDRKLTRLDSVMLEVDREKGLERPACRISVDISTFMAR